MESIESIAAVVVASLTVLPLVMRVLRRFGPMAQVPGMLVCVLAIFAAFAAGSRVLPPPVEEAAIVDRPIESPDDGYVSSESCRACHPKYHATWDASFHSKMTQVASPQSVAGDFDNVTIKRGEAEYKLTTNDGKFFVSAYRTSDPTRVSEPREVVMTTGSHHRQWFWAKSGDSRKITPLPFIYLIDQQQWIPYESGFLLPPDGMLGLGKGEWNRNCIQCHTTQGRMRRTQVGQDVELMDTRVGEFGIACEACHGPAEEHIRANQNPGRRYHYRTTDEHDPTIVNPANLPPELSAHVCGQCHSAMSLIKSRDKATHEKWNQTGFDYRPGENLFESRFLFGYEPHMQAPPIRDFIESNPDYMANRFWSDGVIRVAGREFSGLLKTPCYNHEDDSRKMTCLSCHSMHQPDGDDRDLSEWTNDQLDPELLGNAACTQCHEDFVSDQQVEAHTHHPAGSAGSLCYNCHMPYTTFGLLKAIRSHGLVSPSVQSSLETGRPNACNQCHLDKTLAWTSQRLEEWFDMPGPELSSDQQNIAASVLWTLKGDAGQRALMAWSMGWDAAKQASGTEWITPYLAELLTDPYDAVRFVAWESIKKSMTEFETLSQDAMSYDFLQPEPDRIEFAQRIRTLWDARAADRTAMEGVLVGVDGLLQQDAFDRLLQQRDQRPVSLLE